jgi:hypothetical protein
MKVDGACHCRKITYEAEVEPEQSSICHCIDCQVLSGSAYRAQLILRLTAAWPSPGPSVALRPPRPSAAAYASARGTATARSAVPSVDVTSRLPTISRKRSGTAMRKWKWKWSPRRNR